MIELRRQQIRDDVTRWLIDNFVVLSLGQEIHSFGTGCPQTAIWLYWSDLKQTVSRTHTRRPWTQSA